MKTLLFLFAIISVVSSSTSSYDAEVGEEAVLSIPGKVKTWERERGYNINGDRRKEYIKFCEKGDSKLHCSQFVTKDGKTAEPVTLAVVQADGKLKIKSISSFDGGIYSSPDSKGHEIGVALRLN